MISLLSSISWWMTYDKMSGLINIASTPFTSESLVILITLNSNKLMLKTRLPVLKRLPTYSRNQWLCLIILVFNQIIAADTEFCCTTVPVLYQWRTALEAQMDTPLCYLVCSMNSVRFACHLAYKFSDHSCYNSHLCCAKEEVINATGQYNHAQKNNYHQ